MFEPKDRLHGVSPKVTGFELKKERSSSGSAKEEHTTTSQRMSYNNIQLQQHTVAYRPSRCMITSTWMPVCSACHHWGKLRLVGSGEIWRCAICAISRTLDCKVGGDGGNSAQEENRLQVVGSYMLLCLMQGDTVRGNPRSVETLTAKLSMSTFKGTPLAGRHPRIANTYSSCAIETLDRKKPNVCVYVLKLTQTHSRLTLGNTRHAVVWPAKPNRANRRQYEAKDGKAFSAPNPTTLAARARHCATRCTPLPPSCRKCR